MYKKSPAICLKKTNYTQKDALVTCFTAKFGKDVFLARGVRKPGAKLKSALFPLRGINLTFVQGRNFPVITGAELKMELNGLETNFNYHTLGLFWTEILDLAFVEPEAHPAFFNKFLSVLQILDQEGKKQKQISKKTKWTSIWLIIKLLSTTGYEIQLTRCRSCNKKIKPKGDHKFTPIKGGLVCKGCRKDKMGLISEQARKFLIKLRKTEGPYFELPSKELFEESKNFVLSFLYHQLGQRPSTDKIINW